MRYTYPVLVIEDELGGYCTYLNDFDQVTQGDNIAEAIEMGADLLEIMLDDYLQLDKPLPKPTYPTEHEGLLVAISVDVNTERGLLTTRMAAIELGVSDARVRQMVCSGQLASKKIGRDNYVYLWSIRERQANPPRPGRPRKKAAPAPPGLFPTTWQPVKCTSSRQNLWCSPPAAAARSSRPPRTRTPSPVTVWRSPCVAACRWRTWNSCSSTPPGWPGWVFW